MATLKQCMQTLEERHGGVRKAAKFYDMDKGYWKRLRDGEKTNPSPGLLKALGIVETRSYELPEQASALQDINADLAKVMPGKPLTVQEVFKDLEGHGIDIGHLVPSTEDEMYKHLVQFAGRGIPNPDTRVTGFAGHQWKALGAYNYWQKGKGRIEALYHTGKKLYAISGR